MKKTALVNLICKSNLISLLMLIGCQPLRPLAEIRAQKPASFIEVAGQPIHVERWGDGPPEVVLLHGMAASTYSFRKLGSLMATRGNVLAVDLNGFGFTGRPADPAAYTLGGQAAMVRRVVEHLGGRKIVLVGHSYGALVAIEMASRHPETVESLVLISPPVGEAPLPWYLRSSLARTAMYPLIRVFLSRPDSFRRAFASAFYRDDAFTTDDAEAYRERLLVEGLWNAYRGLTAAVSVGGPAPTGKAASLDVPITILAGQHDKIVPLENLQKFAASMPGVELKILQQSGHSSPEEEPGQVAELIRKARESRSRQ